MLAAPEYVQSWRELRRAGIGDTSAKVQILEFVDFECRACAQYESTLDAVVKRYGGTVSHVFLHYPLDGHRFALPAAKAAECAAELGNFDAMRRVLFAKQDSFGVKPWTSYARDAGVKDLLRFDRCAVDTSISPRISTGAILAKQLGLPGTPTVLVNGWKFVGGPPDSVLSRTIDEIMAGTSPSFGRSSVSRKFDALFGRT